MDTLSQPFTLEGSPKFLPVNATAELLASTGVLLDVDLSACEAVIEELVSGAPVEPRPAEREGQERKTCEQGKERTDAAPQLSSAQFLHT